MKKYNLLTGLVICCGFGLMQGASYAQPAMPKARLNALVRPALSTCTTISGPAQASRIEDGPVKLTSVVPAADRRAFALDRVEKTLNGIWRGEVVGDKGDVHVDYFWIIDTRLSQALIIAQRSGKETVTGPPQLANPPKLSYLMCAHEGYSPGSSTPQMHQFTKISDSTAGAAQIMQKATGVEFTSKQSLADIWQKLVSTGYFDHLKYVAFAGGFFKPLQFSLAPSANGPAQVSLKWDSQYRGGGSTKLKYTTGVPMVGSEQVQFIGVNGSPGDFLMSSLGNGRLWKVEVHHGGDYHLSFDDVSLGPLER